MFAKMRWISVVVFAAMLFAALLPSQAEAKTKSLPTIMTVQLAEESFCVDYLGGCPGKWTQQGDSVLYVDPTGLTSLYVTELPSLGGKRVTYMAHYSKDIWGPQWSSQQLDGVFSFRAWFDGRTVAPGTVWPNMIAQPTDLTNGQ